MLQRVLVPADGLAPLRSHGQRVVDVRRDHALGPPAPGYRSPAAGTALLHELAESTGRGFVVTLGYSTEGRAIDALVVGRPPAEGAPMLRVFAAHHGDEGSSWEVALALASHLTQSNEPRVARILERSTVWLVPFVNPDGASIGSRLNANRVDLNRNYDFAWSSEETFGGPGPFSEPETRAMRAFGHHVQPLASVSLHAGATNFGWVWNHTTERAVDALLMEDIAIAYAAACATPDFWVTNGADWYITYGDTNDWSYGRYGVLDFTVELTRDRVPLPSEISTFVAEHLDALLEFLDQPPTLSGAVVDAGDGSPVMARIEVAGSAAFYADPSTGRFHRWVEPAPLTVSAPGFETATVLAPTGNVRVELVADRRRAGRTTPWALHGSSDVALPALVRGDTITLVRPGSEPMELAAPGRRATVPASRMAPGAWDLVDGEGQTVPHAVWVDNREHVEVVALHADADRLTLLGSGFARGARAWAFVDTQRVPLDVLDVTPDQLALDLGPIADAERIDVGIWVAGAHLGFTDIRSGTAAILDPGCAGCEAAASGASGWWLATLLLWIRRNRIAPA